MKNRERIIVLAPAITRHDVGEAYLGYRLLEGLCQRFSVTLVTYRLRKRQEASLDLPCEEVVSWDEMPLFHRFERFNSMLKPWYVDYFIKARRWLRNRLNRDDGIALVYQLTPMSIRYPSPAAGLGVPLVIGPVGGSVPDLPEFRSEVMATQGQWYMRLRGIDSWRLRHDPFLSRSFRDAARILVTSPHLYALFDPTLRRKMTTFVEHGLDAVYPRTLRAGGTLNLLYVGRVVRTKGLRDAVRALALLPEALDFRFDVVGDGPDLDAVKDETRRLGLEQKTAFHGRLVREKIDAFYARADIFLFPSFREAAGGVIIEAMSHGLPQLCADIGGPAGIVTPLTGFLVEPQSPPRFANEIATVIMRVANDRALLQRLSEGSLKEAAKTYLWPRRVEMLAGELQTVIAESRATGSSSRET